MAKPLRIFSFGGGVQSMAVLVLQSKFKIANDYDAFVFANVGANGENPATLAYLNDIAKPFAEANGLRIIEVQKHAEDGTPETLLDLMMSDAKTVVVPAYTRDTKNKVRRLHRNCTVDFKVGVIDAWIRAEGAEQAEVGLGISLDEFARVKDQNWYDREGKKRLGFWKRREYPLIDKRLTRNDCKAIIREAGLPTPPKSACFFCPFKGLIEWVDFERTQPELFARAVEIDRRLNSKGSAVQGRVSLHRSGIPLENAVAVGSTPVVADDLDTCEDGYCMT